MGSKIVCVLVCLRVSEGGVKERKMQCITRILDKKKGNKPPSLSLSDVPSSKHAPLKGKGEGIQKKCMWMGEKRSEEEKH